MNRMLMLIRASLWNEEIKNEISNNVFEEMKKHNVFLLPTCIFSHLSMSDDLRTEWKRQILQYHIFLERYKNVQNNIPISVPYTILKGTSAAQYYPYPEYRAMGDIDIITDREGFEQAYQDLLNNGYREIKKLNREISLEKDGIIVELHRFFASLNDPKQSKYLDDLIIKNITPSHVLPDLINGLVLLEHIGQHLEHGLGLRQVLDWMMFVDRCLPDEKWAEFKNMAKNLGLKKLAVIVTHMCVLYLGLKERQWSKDADETVCKQLMEYILSSGDFGNKWTSDLHVGQTIFTYVRGPVSTYKWLQERGLYNWKAAQRHAFLRPFAWIYQAKRYILKGFGQEGSTVALRKEYEIAKERIALFDSLGVKQKAKGLVEYRNGKYVKK